MPAIRAITTIYITQQTKVQLTKEALKRRLAMSRLADAILEDWLKGSRKLSYEKE